MHAVVVVRLLGSQPEVKKNKPMLVTFFVGLLAIYGSPWVHASILLVYLYERKGKGRDRKTGIKSPKSPFLACSLSPSQWPRNVQQCPICAAAKGLVLLSVSSGSAKPI